MKTLITGIAGFMGSHMAEYLLGKQEEVSGTFLGQSGLENIEGIKSRIDLHECDIRDADAVKSLINKIKPARIYHLAAQTSVIASRESPVDTFMINVIGCVNVLEAARATGVDPRILLVGSSEEYGQVMKDELPIKESNPLRPLSPYAVSKISQDYLGYQYFKSYGMHLMRVRSFNLTGPRRGEDFVDSNFARQIVMIEMKQKEPFLEVGNLDAYRDFTDVRDIVRANWLAMEKCDAGEVYNLSSGKMTRIKDLLDMLVRISGIKVEIRQIPQRMRPSDEPVIRGDSSKFRAATGWKPEIPLEESLKDLLDYWRARL